MNDTRLVFRESPLAALFAVAFLVCATPIALTVPGMPVLYLFPIGLVAWLLRVRTTVDRESIVARGPLRTRRVAWSEVTALRLRTRSRISAVLSGGAELPLPAVRTRDLPLLAQASGGRLPDPSQPTGTGEAGETSGRAEGTVRTEPTPPAPDGTEPAPAPEPTELAPAAERTEPAPPAREGTAPEPPAPEPARPTATAEKSEE